ncbi:MAG: TonB-dependent receptor family protein, partial [Prolixibacteraceae bacterium]|nr:TonB-dependent receptor family protein [Prolixibacteraceae bacterium]
ADRFIEYTTVANNGATHHESNKNIEITTNNYAFETEVNYKTILNSNGQQLEAFVSYSEHSGKDKMKNSLYYSNGSHLQNTSALQLNKEWYGGVEFLHPVNKRINCKGGYHLSDQNFRNNFNSESYDMNAANWYTDTELASRFTYHRHTEALSFVFGITNTTWDGDIGFRAEYTSTTQNQNKTQSGLEIFPTINLAGKVNGRHTVYFAYGRRINRPSVKMLDPFASKYADELNIHQGNPDLTPELVNSFEVGDRFSYEKFSGSVSLYYRYINQAISRVKLACNDSAVSVTYLNLGHATLGGCDFVFSYRPFTWCEITPAANFFSASLTGNAGSNIVDGCEFAWNGSVSFLFRVPKILNLRMAGYYRSELPSIMGTYNERWYADLAVSKKIFKNKGQIIFKIEDVFDSYLYGLSVNGCNDDGYHFSQQNKRKIDTAYFALSFIYNIDGNNQPKKTGKESFYLDSFEK